MLRVTAKGSLPEALHSLDNKKMTQATFSGKVEGDGDLWSSPRDGAAEAATASRPTWQQSERDVAYAYPDYTAQKSFIQGEEVTFGRKGSSRPDFYKMYSSIEVKNYNLGTVSGRNSLISIVSKQVNERIINLPQGTVQTIIIDIRGQKVSPEILQTVKSEIRRRCNTTIFIKFMRWQDGSGI